MAWLSWHALFLTAGLSCVLSGEAPTEEELFRFMADVDEDGTGAMEHASGSHQSYQHETATCSAPITMPIGSGKF